MLTLETRNLLGVPSTFVDDIGGVTLSSFWPLLVLALEKTKGNIVEIGADRGFVTVKMAAEAKARGRQFFSVDPSPASAVDDIPNCQHVRSKSSDFFKDTDVCAEVWIVDGDHNYATVAMELQNISQRVEGDNPLVFLHDIGWPWGRRDLWYNPAEAPAGAVRVQEGMSVSLDAEGVVKSSEGINLNNIAAVSRNEGGHANGVMTAVEDFLETDAGREWMLVKTPIFYGFGLLVRRQCAENNRDLLRKFEAFNEVGDILGSLEANRLRLLQTLNQKWTDSAAKDRELAECRKAMRSFSGYVRYALSRLKSKRGA